MSAAAQPTGALPAVLLLQPQFVLRRTVADTAQALGLALVQEAASVDVAENLLASTPFDGLLLSLAPGPRALQLLARLRAGDYTCRPDVPVIATCCDDAPDMHWQLQSYGVHARLPRPFRVKSALAALRQLPVGNGPRA